MILQSHRLPQVTDVAIDEVPLHAYDTLLDSREGVVAHG
jgi:hypothetical protein